MKKKLSEKTKKRGEYNFTKPVSIVTHNLKTPLSVIKGYLEVLLSGDLGELNNQQKEYLRDILENTQQMITLVKDILDVARIEANQLVFIKKPTNLAGLAKETIKEFSTLAKAKNCILSLQILNKPPSVKTDPVKVKQVMYNIISNALFYNKRKGEVKVSLFRKGKRVVFCCKDSGIGIGEKEKKKIFAKFYRSSRAIPLITSGSGLGLFISKAIIEKMEGKIWFKSEEGKGSTFCFSLPVKQ